MLNDVGHYRSIGEYDTYKGGGTPYRVADTLAAAQVQYIETKVPISVVCFKQCLVGVGSKIL